MGLSIPKYFKVRKPDVILGEPENPYMLRWHLIPRNRFFNVYLHRFLRSDDDRALHDHPWWSVGMILKGNYIEHMPCRRQDGYAWKKDRAEYTKVRKAFRPVFRASDSIHRVELFNFDFPGLFQPITKPVWTIFITGPKVREWGFWCKKGFVNHRDFLATTGDTGVSRTGAGCGDDDISPRWPSKLPDGMKPAEMPKRNRTQSPPAREYQYQNISDALKIPEDFPTCDFSAQAEADNLIRSVLSSEIPEHVEQPWIDNTKPVGIFETPTAKCVAEFSIHWSREGYSLHCHDLPNQLIISKDHYAELDDIANIDPVRALELIMNHLHGFEWDHDRLNEFRRFVDRKLQDCEESIFVANTEGIEDYAKTVKLSDDDGQAVS